MLFRIALRMLATMFVAAASLMACGGGDSDEGRAVTTEEVSNETTSRMLVFAPDEEGPWPVVYLLHGVNGTADDMSELGRRVASEGAVVFAPTYRTDLSSEEAFVELARDVECGYRFARSIAADHGGDLDLPVTFVGWSLGAILAVQGGLDEEIDPNGQYISCFAEVPRADVIVGISGCYYEFDGAPVTILQPSEWANPDVGAVLVSGDADETCAASQTADLATALQDADYDVDQVTLEGADHFAPIFHELDGETMVAASDESAGERTVAVIIDAIARAQRDSGLGGLD